MFRCDLPINWKHNDVMEKSNVLTVEPNVVAEWLTSLAYICETQFKSQLRYECIVISKGILNVTLICLKYKLS